jgi:hypothetical protein
MAERVSVPECLLLIPAPSDRLVYLCFRSLAQRWKTVVTADRVTLIGNLPLTAGLTHDTVPPAIKKLVEAELDTIAGIELEIGGLAIAYVRSGGHGPAPYRKSFFDEVRLSIRGSTPLTGEEVAALIRQLYDSLDARATEGVAEFTCTVQLEPARDPSELC